MGSITKKFTEEQEQAILSLYVSNTDKNVFFIYDSLPHEQWATISGAYSRTHLGFRERLLKAIEEEDFDLSVIESMLEGESRISDEKRSEKARRFIQKWAQDYGHNSLKELSCVRFCVEHIPDLIARELTGRRLVSAISKSTRYIDWKEVLGKTVINEKISSSSHAERFRETLQQLYQAYNEVTQKLQEYVKEQNKDYLKERIKEKPEDRGVIEKAFNRAASAKAFDAARYLLLPSIPTSKALTMNARTLEYLITRLLSHPLKEAQDLGQEIWTEARKPKVLPILLGDRCHAGKNEFLINAKNKLKEFSETAINPKFQEGEITDRVNMIGPEKSNNSVQLAASLVYPYSHLSFNQLYEYFDSNRQDIQAVVDLSYDGMTRFDGPMRELEHQGVMFELLMDYGAYRDVHRHRMGTRSRQLLTTDHGFECPELIVAAGLRETYDSVLQKCHETFKAVEKDLPFEAQYIVPFAARCRTLFSWNLRQLQYFIELRSRKEGNPSYRKIAQELYEKLSRRFPEITKHIRVSFEEVPMGRLDSAIRYFKKKQEFEQAEQTKQQVHTQKID